MNPHGLRGGVRQTGALVCRPLSLFFLVLGIYAVLQRRSEHQVLAQQTEKLSVPFVSVIHATPIDDNSQMVLPGSLKASLMESPIYARTNGYLKKWYKDIGSSASKAKANCLPKSILPK